MWYPFAHPQVCMRRVTEDDRGDLSIESKKLYTLLYYSISALFPLCSTFSFSLLKHDLSIGGTSPRLNPWLPLNSFPCLQSEDSFIRSLEGIAFFLLVCQIAYPNNHQPEQSPTQTIADPRRGRSIVWDWPVKLTYWWRRIWQAG